jgi:hypothetical protein
MKALFNQVTFDTKVGTVRIFIQENNKWYYDFTSGYAFGLYNEDGFSNFDKCYARMKKVVLQQAENMKYDN